MLLSQFELLILSVENTGKKKQIPNIGYFRIFKEYPQKSQIWQSETSPNQGIPNQVPWLGLVSLFQIWDFCGFFLNTLKYPKMGICYFSCETCFANLICIFI